jgi:hypothetical protein
LAGIQTTLSNEFIVHQRQRQAFIRHSLSDEAIEKLTGAHNEMERTD